MYAPPFFTFGNKFFLTGSILLSYLFIKNQLTIKKNHLPLFFKTLLFANLMPGLLRMWSLQYMPPYKLAIITNLSPFFTYLLSIYIEKIPFEYKKIIGISIGFLSIIPLLVSHAPQEEIIQAFLFFSWAELAALTADVSRSFGLFATQQLTRELQYSPLTINGISMSIAGFIGIICSFIFESSRPLIAPASFYSIVFLSIFISGILAHSMYIYLLKKYSVPFITFTSFSLTIFTALLGWLFLDNVITWHFYCALLGLVISLCLFCYNDIKIMYTTQNTVL